MTCQKRGRLTSSPARQGLYRPRPRSRESVIWEAALLTSNHQSTTSGSARAPDSHRATPGRPRSTQTPLQARLEPNEFIIQLGRECLPRRPQSSGRGPANRRVIRGADGELRPILAPELHSAMDHILDRVEHRGGTYVLGVETLAMLVAALLLAQQPVNMTIPSSLARRHRQ